MRAGRRLRVVRYLVGLTVSDMVSVLGFSSTKRYQNVESLHAKMNEEDFLTIYKSMPEILLFVLSGEPLSRKHLKKSKTLLNTVPSRIDAGLVPDDFDLSMIKD